MSGAAGLSLTAVATLLTTDRLVLRDWSSDDADAALTIYGSPDVARWLTPAMDRVPDSAAMGALLTGWSEEQATLLAPQGRWAIEQAEDGAVVGGLIVRTLPPVGNDLELSWQLQPDAWGQGYAAEAARGVAGWAFTQEVDELFAVARPTNTRAIATATRIGMQWVGETTKYYDLRLQVYRLRPADLA
jgi:RimJ/RimL family protein N-acetyltransferase